MENLEDFFKVPQMVGILLYWFWLSFDYYHKTGKKEKEMCLLYPFLRAKKLYKL